MSSSSGSPRTSGSHPIGPTRKKRPWWLVVLAGVIVVLVLLLVLSRCGNDDDTSPAGLVATPPGSSSTAPEPEQTSSEPSSTGLPSASATPTDSTSETAGTTPVPASSGDAGGDSLTAGGTLLLPLDAAAINGSLRNYREQSVTATAVQVLTVPADEGFWVGTSDADRVWVQIVGSGESPYHVRPGDVVDFTGSMDEHAKGYAARVGVDRAEGAELLTRQRAHVSAEQSTLMLSSG